VRIDKKRPPTGVTAESPPLLNMKRRMRLTLSVIRVNNNDPTRNRNGNKKKKMLKESWLQVHHPNLPVDGDAPKTGVTSLRCEIDNPASSIPRII
jgi:hypothetical protein